MLFLSLTLGLLIGSFLNVCIYRIPRKEDIVYTPSHCFNCGSRVKWYDLIPVLSYILLGGKCRQCHEKISKQYPIIELSNGAAYMGIYWLYGISFQTVLVMALFSVLLVISIIDIRHSMIPNGLVLFIAIIAIIHLILNNDNIIQYIIGFFAVSGLLFLIAIITRGQMGGGDIKLMAVSGLFLGWQNIILALFIGSVIGSVIGLILIGLKVVKRKQRIPFGPFLAMGILISELFGTTIIQSYLDLFYK
jgi:leader peptidase (prepilin peptidase)/N-methyltransferase